ncbi:Lrp/AsnC family transcriptional regulator [Pseudarthrobacter sp. R1]|uniref:Lrp/AsnC family transcriptional regulator n=1 Tax=Pseudarthrobacter sp. R1 TaxID=2944934 RepID=UPI00210AAEA4|nr:Lrp/AsnC family transcriptional regulator [Pseudarthrobacter sp. R1]MCQ6273346.1 Lrp/AsnC family transcriptional regulator [Pseudarthrobacter sp. R1]
MTDFALDDLDRGIMRELELDGRRAFREIGRNLGTSEATVRARVKRLQDQNILRIIAFADPASLGRTQLGIVFLEVEPDQHEAVVEAVSALPEVTYVSTILGRADLCVEVLSNDNNALWTILNERIGRLPGVRRMETTTVLKVHKLRYQSPTGP